MLDMELLKKYIAKTDGTTIYEHNKDLINILEQIKDVYSLSDEEYRKLKDKIIPYHDIGKVTEEYQFDMTNTHRKVRHELISASCSDLELDEKLPILFHHKDLSSLSKKIMNMHYKGFCNEVAKKLNIQTDDVMKLIMRLNVDATLRKMLGTEHLIFLKGFLQYCDNVASAGIKYIDKGMNTYNHFKFPKLNSIQRKVVDLNSKEDIIINGMTGLGKSATAMYWTDKMQNKNKSRRIYYMLPYTASINSMYKDFKDRGMSVGMLHGKAEYFIYKELSDSYNAKQTYNLFKKSINQTTITTLYQILKSFFLCKNFEMNLAQYRNSIFVIDEIHCFDIKELTLILMMLKHLKEKLGISICIMSASIPTCLIELIKKELDIKTVIMPDKEDLIIRHHINYIDSPILNNLNAIENDLLSEKKVLVCVNTVKLSQEIYRAFKDKFEITKVNPKLIHSRFNLRDRERIEENLKSEYLLIGTQCIEVSLDIDYDVLYTELAPLDCLLQRFGRVNRRGEKGIAEVFVFCDSSKKIYDEELESKTLEVISDIIITDNGYIYEEKITSYLDKIYEGIEMDDKYVKIFQSSIKNMKVGNYNKIDELENFDTLSVIPENLVTKFKDYIALKQYEEANSLLVNVKKSYSKDIVYDADVNTFIINKEYSVEEGLIL